MLCVPMYRVNKTVKSLAKHLTCLKHLKLKHIGPCMKSKRKRSNSRLQIAVEQCGISMGKIQHVAMRL